MMMRPRCFSSRLRVPSWFGVQQAADFFSGSFSVVTLKGFHLHTGGVSLAQARRQLHLGVDRIIVLDEAADETDDDYRRQGVGSQSRERIVRDLLGDAQGRRRGKGSKCAASADLHCAGLPATVCVGVTDFN